ncbi:efflux RND transporter permease subunit [Halomonas litopenaei]|uniref:efflux RND transporter permease subunit n=1 Tax=Halomonas litopenaei TaxID=2109328 RepID=UPI001A8FB194|nr:efflux RND transporter permease subunit [Halomonas litopenaei]MBN8414317.1 efflux RND transporter permease subunit [Halomonas litopenaei]
MSDTSHRQGVIAWFARNPVAANLLMLLVIALGVSALGTLQKEAFPSTEPDSLSISVSYDSGSARQSEEGLAIKIEDALEGVIGIDSIVSTSTTSGTTVTVEKTSDYDLDTLLRDVKTQVDAISNFPADADNPVISKAEREEHSLWIQLYGDADRATLQQLADDLKADLLAHQDVSRVSISGWLDPMMAIEIDEGRLEAYGLSLSDVEEAVNASSTSTSSAVLRNADLYLQLKASRQAYLKDEFAAIPLITTTQGDQIRLGDVARIRDTFDDTTSSLSRFDGEDSIALQIVTTGTDDISDSVIGAREVIQQWRDDGLLPQNVQLATWYDRSTSINERLALLIDNALYGILLVFTLLALFLNLRVALWVAMGLPFVFCGTLYFMGEPLLGLTLNEFTTFGFIMALGIVVDDAVVVGESVYAERRAHGDTLDSTIRGTLRVAVPTLFGVFTTVVAFFALSQIEGRLGKLYAQFAAVVGLCLVLSIIESKLILPAHLAHLNTRSSTSRHCLGRLWGRLQDAASGAMERFTQAVYRPLVKLALVHRASVTVLFTALLILVLAMPFNGSIRMSFFPDIAGDTARANITLENDASYGLTHRALDRLQDSAIEADATLRQGKGVSAIEHLQITSSDDQSGTVTVKLADDSPYDLDQFAHQWTALAGLPEGTRTLSVQSRRSDFSALRVELRASDDTLLSAAGDEFRARLEAIDAVSGLEDNLRPGQPQLQLDLTAQGRALGMSTDELAEQVMQGFNGQVVQRYQRGNDEIEVKVRFPESERQSLVDVLSSRVRAADGTVLPLSSVATASLGYTRDTITRIDNQRAIYISGDVDKELISATELVTLLEQEVVPDIRSAYPGVDIHFAGEAEQQQETQSSMVTVFAFAILLIYMLLAVPLKSYVQPLLIMTAIPFGVVGALLGHWLNDLSLGILSLNGIIALSGVVVNDSLLLVSRFNELRDEGLAIPDAIVASATSRMRAVVLTSATTFAGLYPLLGETSHQAQFLIPAAVSLAYGILFATLITLILIPVLLSLQTSLEQWLTRWRRRTPGEDEAETPC